MTTVISPPVALITAQELEELVQECCSQQLIAAGKVGPLDDGDGPGAAAVVEVMWLGMLLGDLRAKLGPFISQLQ
jgi:hypothetical protein